MLRHGPAAPGWSRPVLTAALVYLADQGTKLAGEVFFRARVIVPGLLGIRPLYNPGLVFGLWRVPHLQLVTLAVSLAVFCLTFRLCRGGGGYSPRPALAAACGLIWGGVLGNQTDRLIFGAVFDFIHLWRIPVFNLADLALTAGALILALELLLRRPPTDAGNENNGD